MNGYTGPTWKIMKLAARNRQCIWVFDQIFFTTRHHYSKWREWLLALQIANIIEGCFSFSQSDTSTSNLHPHLPLAILSSSRAEYSGPGRESRCKARRTTPACRLRGCWCL